MLAGAATPSVLRHLPVPSPCRWHVVDHWDVLCGGEAVCAKIHIYCRGASLVLGAVPHVLHVPTHVAAIVLCVHYR
jgi:hypothetical protein